MDRGKTRRSLRLSAIHAPYFSPVIETPMLLDFCEDMTGAWALIRVFYQEWRGNSASLALQI